ncbi:MAG TPA: hypothetical protein VNO50_19630 [Pyrinomonadaceae bacterium]|nr:hypothetical protein [Pyrinomonadaceae bacterium]
MLKRIIYLLAFLSLVSTGVSFAQQPAQPELGPAELKDLVRRAGLGMSEYKIRFKDLTAEEDQKVEEYDQQGKLQKQRRIASDLVIYQSQLDPTQMVEYRDVKLVDGVAVKKREARLMSLLNKSAKADSVKKELDRVNRESSRYDLGFSFYGMTLYQGLPLQENALDAFKFTFAGREQVDGHDAIIVDYQQVSQTPSFAFNPSSLPSPLKGSEALHRGRIWLDAETAQIRREVREMTLQPPSVNRPLVFTRYEFDYADSRFGFLTPKRIVITNNSRGRTGADKKPELLLGVKITFDYGAFSRFEVETPDASLDPPAKP